MTPDLVQVIVDQGWFLGKILCPSIRFSQQQFLYNSLLTQVAISIERYLAICAPFQMKRISRKIVLLSIVAIWILAMVFALPYLLLMRSFRFYIPDLNFEFSLCLFNDEIWKTFIGIFKYFECALLYFIPLGILSVLYFRTCQVLWGSNDNQTALQGDQEQALFVLNLRRNVVKMLIICFGVYFLCYTPIQAIFLAESISGKRLRIDQITRMIFHGFVIGSSAINPLVYTICCKHFRRKLKR